jgi:hypothetical protein
VALDEVEEGPPKLWRLHYVTELSIGNDAQAVFKEIHGLWSELRPEAERRTVDEVHIKAWDTRWRIASNHYGIGLAKGDSRLEVFRRGDDGVWSSPW